jgi:hypothetical protein
MEEGEFVQVTEQAFWLLIAQYYENQKGLPYDHLKVSGRTGFYKNDDETLYGYVERVLAHSSYFINKKIYEDNR